MFIAAFSIGAEHHVTIEPRSFAVLALHLRELDGVGWLTLERFRLVSDRHPCGVEFSELQTNGVSLELPPPWVPELADNPPRVAHYVADYNDASFDREWPRVRAGWRLRATLYNPGDTPVRVMLGCELERVSATQQQQGHEHGAAK